jgi:putative transposase
MGICGPPRGCPLIGMSGRLHARARGVRGLTDEVVAARAALNSAVARRAAQGLDVVGCVLHSDRGSQFRSRKPVGQLNRHGMVGSMGRAGAAGDNAPIGRFFSLLQKNVLNRRSWNTREHMRIAIETWIERTYHRRRRQVAIGRLTPVEYELIMTTTATRAAKLKLSPVRAADPASKRW